MQRIAQIMVLFAVLIVCSANGKNLAEAGDDPNTANFGPPACTDLPGPCIHSGTDADINAALKGKGSIAVLCPGAKFLLRNPVKFTAPHQQICTQGGKSLALLKIQARDLSTAIDGMDQSNVVVEYIKVDGNRRTLGYKQGGALILMGGAASGQVVRNIIAKDTRSWSTMHFFEGAVIDHTPQCQDAVITGNKIGPAGTADGRWADGISLACGNSLVANNTVSDATDGAIVVFGAPGSIIRKNTIIAKTRELLGGINMVDYAPVNGNYTNTRVTGNIINGQGAFIKVGIAMGLRVWGCPPKYCINYGGVVKNNLLKGVNFGYGYAINGVRKWTVIGNRDLARHVGLVGEGCGGTPSQPAGYQYESVGSVTLQSQFSPAHLSYVLAITEPPILAVAKPPSGCTYMYTDQGLYPQKSLYSCDKRFRLILQSDGNLVLYDGNNPLWVSNTAGMASAVALMQSDGNFVVYDSTGLPIWSSGTQGSPGAYLAVQNDGNMVIYDSNNHPVWATNTCCH